MSSRNKPFKGRGRDARSRSNSDKLLFEQTLRGEDRVGSTSFDASLDRKTLQLCRQVERALILALAGECDDELLRDISVNKVVPAGGAGHLVVCVVVPATISVTQVLTRLDTRSGRLRSIIAAAICRKRTPMLSFVAVPTSEGGIHVE